MTNIRLAINFDKRVVESSSSLTASINSCGLPRNRLKSIKSKAALTRIPRTKSSTRLTRQRRFSRRVRYVRSDSLPSYETRGFPILPGNPLESCEIDSAYMGPREWRCSTNALIDGVGLLAASTAFERPCRNRFPVPDRLAKHPATMLNAPRTAVVVVGGDAIECGGRDAALKGDAVNLIAFLRVCRRFAGNIFDRLCPRLRERACNYVCTSRVLA